MIPLAVLIVVFWVGFRSWLSARVPPKDSIEVRVTASKWTWEFQYPTHALSDKELIVPLNTPSS